MTARYLRTWNHIKNVPFPLAAQLALHADLHINTEEQFRLNAPIGGTLLRSVSLSYCHLLPSSFLNTWFAYASWVILISFLCVIIKISAHVWLKPWYCTTWRTKWRCSSWDFPILPPCGQEMLMKQRAIKRAQLLTSWQSPCMTVLLMNKRWRLSYCSLLKE